MSSLGICLILTLLSFISAQNDTSNKTLSQAQNLTEKISHNETIETTTRDPEHEHGHEPHLHSLNKKQEESTHPTPPPPHQPPHLRFNPPDFSPFPKLGLVRQFWRDRPNLKAIPDLPTRDTEYPEWLLAVMGGFRPPTHTPTATKDDQVSPSENNRPLEQPEVQPLESKSLDFESGDFNSEILPEQNNMEGRLENNNVPLQTETGNREFILPPVIHIQQPLLNSRIHQLRPVPEIIQRPTENTVNPDISQNQKEPIFFRIPLNLGFGRIQHLRNSNNQRNPKNFVIVRENRFESHQSSNPPVQMVALHHEDFREIPVTISRPSVVHQSGILMLPVRNQNEPSHFRRPNFIQSHSPRMAPVRERFILAPNQNRVQNPSFAKQNAILVDPPFSRESWPRVLEQDENLERLPTVMNQRQVFEMPEKQQADIPKNTMIQQNESLSLAHRPRIGVRQKRQAGFESFDPFGMGNLFSIFPSEKEEPHNSFNWFPRDPIIRRPTQQSPINSGIFIPSSNRRPTSRPKQQHTFPQDNWMIIPDSSSNTMPTFQSPQMNNHGSSNGQLPKDFMIIQPQRPSQRKSNQMPWMINNLFGGDLFPENKDGEMWTFQRPFDQNSGTNNNQPHHHQQPTRPPQEEQVSPRNDQQFIVQPPVFHPNQNYHPSQGQTHINNIQPPPPPPSHLPPPINRNNMNQGSIQVIPNRDQLRPHVQPRQHWRPASQVPVQSQPQLPPQGTWIPSKSTPKETPVSSTNHFQPVPHQQPQPTEQSPTPSRIPTHHEDRHHTHRQVILPEIQKGKHKLSPSEVRHLLSLLPEFPKDIYKKPVAQSNPTGHTVGITVNSTGSQHKRSVHTSLLKPEDIDDGNFTRNYPGPNRMHPSESRNSNQQSPKDRKKRDIEESLIRDVVFGSYGYHSEQDYPDSSFSDFSSPFLGFTTGNNHGSGSHHLWGNMFPGSGHNLFNSVWNWPHPDYYLPHLGHANGHLHPTYHPSHFWHGNMHPLNPLHPLNHGHLPGSRSVTAIPLAVPRANPNQMSYTARFRYRFGILPGYSDYVPSIDDHNVFFFYDANQRNRRPDVVIPFRSY